MGAFRVALEKDGWPPATPKGPRHGGSPSAPPASTLARGINATG